MKRFVVSLLIITMVVSMMSAVAFAAKKDTSNPNKGNGKNKVVTEEPVAEEPVVEEPVAEEPVVEEPVVEEPVAEEPVAEEPVVEEPVVEEPVTETPDERTIITVNDTSDFMALVSNMPENAVITGGTNGATIELNQDTSVKFDGLNNVEFTNLHFTNMKYMKVSNSNNITFTNTKFSNFARTGLYFDYTNNIEVSHSTFVEMGSPSIEVTWQGNAIYVSNADGLVIKNNDISRTYGLGSIFASYTTNLLIDSNEIYDTALRAVNIYKGGSTGLISNNYVHDIGTINFTGSGVGANGIFAEAEAYDIDVINNTTINLQENGIEGKFGLVEGNYVENTGMDLENFPTPSPEGIYANGSVYRNNIVKNTNGDGIKVYSGYELANITIIHNHLSQTVTGHNGIAFISMVGYSNILIENNTIINYEQSIFIHNDPDDGSVEIALNDIH